MYFGELVSKWLTDWDDRLVKKLDYEIEIYRVKVFYLSFLKVKDDVVGDGQRIWYYVKLLIRLLYVFVRDFLGEEAGGKVFASHASSLLHQYGNLQTQKRKIQNKSNKNQNWAMLEAWCTCFNHFLLFLGKRIMITYWSLTTIQIKYSKDHLFFQRGR